MPIFKVFLFAMCGLSTSMASQENPSGWLWYQDPEIPHEEVEKKQETPKEQPSQMPAAPKSATERLEEMKKQFEEAKAKAILEPTLENVAVAQRLHNAMIDQATEFQKSWAVAELLDPNFKLIQTSPGSRNIKRDQEQKVLEDDLKKLSKSYGLIFAFKSDCPYCHQFAPLVTKFAKQYGFSLQGLSRGEGCFKDMTCSKNESALLAVNPKLEFPILYLANPDTNEVIPVARGYIGLDALLANFEHAIRFLKSEGQF